MTAAENEDTAAAVVLVTSLLIFFCYEFCGLTELTSVVNVRCAPPVKPTVTSRSTYLIRGWDAFLIIKGDAGSSLISTAVVL